MTREITTILKGFTFFEGPRWRDGRFWASDLHEYRVISCLEDGKDVRIEATLDVPPAGIGWLPDGRLLISATAHRKILRREPDGTLVTHGDLSDVARGWVNDFAVDQEGRAYVGHFGFDLFAGEGLEPTQLFRVDPDGSVTSVSDGVWFPNGAVITRANELLVDETFGNRISSFQIQEDGTLSERRTWAEFGPLPTSTDLGEATLGLAVCPDGCALDGDGALWVADIRNDRAIRVQAGGQILDEVTAEMTIFACALGGEDGHTLFLCVAPDSDPGRRKAHREAEIRTVRVDVAAN